MPEIDVTEEIQEKYLEDPNRCPYCDSDNINGGHIEAGDNNAWRFVSCKDCKISWTEDFTLTGIGYVTKPV